MVDGSWLHNAFFSDCGWIWNYFSEETQLRGTRIQSRRLSPLYSEVEPLIWAMQSMIRRHSTCQFGTDSSDLIPMIKNLGVWQNFSTKLKETTRLREGLQNFMLICIIYK